MDTVDKLIAFAIARGDGALSEYESKLVLAEFGVPVTAGDELAASEKDALAAAARIGYPVAVKACAPDLAHKTERDLVHLDVAEPDQLTESVNAIDRAMDGSTDYGYLVQRMVRGRREFIVGAVRDPSFGPCVMLGLGGILVEAVDDVVFRLVPLDKRDAVEMVDDIKAQALLGEFRGEPEVDRGSLASILVALGRVISSHSSIAQIDVNPLVIEDGQPVAVDALVTLSTSPEAHQ